MATQTPPIERHPLEIVSGTYSVLRLAPDAPVPGFVMDSVIWSLTRTDTELSILCLCDSIPEDFQTTPDTREDGYRALRICGALDFSEIGILANLLNVIAAVKVSVLTLSTFDTDYIFVPGADLNAVTNALVDDGYRIER